MKEKRWALIMLNRTALTVFLYASFLYFLKRIVFVKRHVWFFRIYMAFCPTSGLFYFGMLIPMSAMESEGYLLPVIFALATGLPVMLVAWILAYSVAGVGKFYNRVQTFQKWFNYMVAILFILVGIYYGLINLDII